MKITNYNGEKYKKSKNVHFDLNEIIKSEQLESTDCILVVDPLTNRVRPIEIDEFLVYLSGKKKL